MNTQLLLESGGATLMAALGAAIATLAAGRSTDDHRRRVRALVYFSAGALIAVTIGSVLPESAAVLTLPGAIFAAATGAALFYVIGRFVCPICPACSITGDHAHNGGGEAAVPALLRRPRAASTLVAGSDLATASTVRRTAILIACIVSAHAALDGVAIATGHESAARTAASNGASMTAAVAAGVPLIAALSLHKLPEGLALAGLILGGGFGRWRSFLLTAGIESATLLGAALGATVCAAAPPALLAAFLAHTGGGFSCLSLQALGGRSAEDGNTGHVRYVYGTAGFLAAAALLAAVHHIVGA